MMVDPDKGGALWQLSVTEASQRIAAGTLSPVDLVEACLARVEAVDGKIHSFIHVAAEAAREAAREAEAEIKAGRLRGPLHGIPYGVKDNYDAAGMPATAGSRVRLDHVPTEDAALIAQLKQAGAILLGKLNTWEFGTGNGGEYFDLPFPTARNAWDPERFAGGSSTGTGTSVAAGTTLFALGSDTTGSVRLPASATGTLGLIATSDVLDRTGILPNCYTLDKPGILAWTAADTALILGELAPATKTSAAPRGLVGMRIAVVNDPGPGLPRPDQPLAEALETAVALLRAEGAIIEVVEMPVSAADCFAVSRLIGPPESAAIHEKELRERPSELGFALRDKLMAGSLVSAVDYITAQRRRAQIAAAIDGLINRFDALVTYGPLHVAPRLGVEPEMTAFSTETMLTPFNLSDHPALMQCIGFTSGGLPLSWQVVGRRGGEATILDLAAAYEARTPWRSRRAMTENT